MFTLKMMTSDTLDLLFIYLTILHTHFFKSQAIFPLPNTQITVLPSLNSLNLWQTQPGAEQERERDQASVRILQGWATPPALTTSHLPEPGRHNLPLLDPQPWTYLPASLRDNHSTNRCWNAFHMATPWSGSKSLRSRLSPSPLIADMSAHV